MKVESKFSRFILVSPWFLSVFLVIPLLVILSVSLHIRIPLVDTARLLLVNNILFTVIAAFRLARYLAGMNNSIRYGSSYCRPRKGEKLAVAADDVRGSLSREGFSFDGDDNYGEKRDTGYIGTTVLYGGLFILLSVGCWDNLQQFSGVLLDGMGPATSLNKVESYRHISKGALAAIPTTLPRMSITNQILPDSTYPMGATELTLFSADGKAERLLLKPREPISVGSYEMYMAKFVFEPQIVIKAKATQATVFDSIVRLDPLVEKRGPFSFYGLFQGALVGGGVYYQPEKSTLMVVISRGGNKTVADMTFQIDQQVEQGDYILSCAKMGQWSEIHVVHKRHKALLALGAVVALSGLLLRLAIRPHRVWLEEAGAGSTIRVSDKETLKLLKAKG